MCNISKATNLTRNADLYIFLNGDTKGVGKGGGSGGAEAPPPPPPPQILTHVTLLQKNVEKTREEKQLSGYKHAN